MYREIRLSGVTSKRRSNAVTRNSRPPLTVVQQNDLRFLWRYSFPYTLLRGSANDRLTGHSRAFPGAPQQNPAAL